MKYFIFLFLVVSLSCISNNAICQKTSIICGKVRSAEKFNINFYEPINGYFNYFFLDTTIQNSSLINGIDSIYKKINVTQPSFVTIYFTNANNEFITSGHVLISPGDSLHIDCDLNRDDSNSIIYTGSNAMGQKLFNEINFQPYNKFIPVFDALDRLPGNKNTLVKEVDSISNAVINRFDSLLKQSLVSEKFVEYINICFRSLFYDEVIKKFLGESKKKEVISKSERDSILFILFTKMPATDVRLKGLYIAPFFIENYYNYLTYKKYNLNSIKPLRNNGNKKYTVSGHSYLINEAFVPLTYMKNTTIQRDLWAIQILSYFSYLPGEYNHSIIDQFDSIFSKNIWTNFLEKQYENRVIITKLEYKLQSPILFVDTTKEIKTIENLLSNLPRNKSVFIDIWATWCGPCISAFTYNKVLDSFLLKNDIERLYISRDDIEDAKKWKEAIKKYSLGGYHILAGKSLVFDLRKTIYKIEGNEGMPIPRYLLVNKQGKIVLEDAPSPSNFIELKEQINKVLNLN